MVFVSSRPMLTLALLAVSAGCSPQTSKHSSEARSDGYNQAGKSTLSLEGSWQAAEVDGRTLVGVTLKGANGVLAWEPDCAGWWIKYRQDGGAIRFTPMSRPPGGTEVVCLIGFPESLGSIFGALAGANRIEASDAGSIRLTGGGHTVLLERLLPAAQRPVRSLEGRWSVATLDGKRLPKGSLAFIATADIITWEPSCAAQARSYAIENDRISIARMPDAPPPPPPIGGQIAPPPRPICAIGLHPHLQLAFAAMEAATHIRPTTDGGLMINGNGREIVLLPVTG